MQDLPNIAALNKMLDLQPEGSVAWLEASLQKILMLQVMDRDKCLSNSSYWGDTGYWVGVALDEAAPIVLQSVPPKNQSAWLQEIYAEMEVRLEAFRRHEEDPDGYGSATLQEIMKEVARLASRLDSIKADTGFLTVLIRKIFKKPCS